MTGTDWLREREAQSLLEDLDRLSRSVFNTLLQRDGAHAYLLDSLVWATGNGSEGLRNRRVRVAETARRWRDQRTVLIDDVVLHAADPWVLLHPQHVAELASASTIADVCARVVRLLLLEQVLPSLGKSYQLRGFEIVERDSMYSEYVDLCFALARDLIRIPTSQLVGVLGSDDVQRVRVRSRPSASVRAYQGGLPQ